jgi:phage I-like protein
MDIRLRTQTVLAADQIDEDGRSWIEVMPTADKARNGPYYFTVTEADLETYAQSIRDSPAESIQVDYDHADGGTRAAGWFTGQAEVRDNGDGPRLMAEVQWTPRARQEIADGEFRKISPEYTFQSKDAKTGLMTKAKAIVAATLTNRPFFKELAAVTAADLLWDASMGYQQRMCEISEALNPPGTWAWCVLDVGDGVCLVQENGDDAYVIPFTIVDGEAELAPMSEWKPAEQQWVAAAAEARAKVNAGAAGPKKEKTMSDELKAVAVELGLAEDADQATVTAAIAKLKDTQPAEDAVVVKADDLTELRAHAAEGRAAKLELDEMKVDTLVKAAVADGKIDPVVADEFKAMAKENYTGTAALLEKMPKRSLKEIGSGGTGPGDDPVTATEVRIGGVAVPVDEESARVAARTQKILDDDGTKTPTTDEYLAAAAQARRELAAA